MLEVNVRIWEPLPVKEPLRRIGVVLKEVSNSILIKMWIAVVDFMGWLWVVVLFNPIIWLHRIAIIFLPTRLSSWETVRCWHWSLVRVAAVSVKSTVVKTLGWEGIIKKVQPILIMSLEAKVLMACWAVWLPLKHRVTKWVSSRKVLVIIIWQATRTISTEDCAFFKVVS